MLALVTGTALGVAIGGAALAFLVLGAPVVLDAVDEAYPRKARMIRFGLGIATLGLLVIAALVVVAIGLGAGT